MEGVLAQNGLGAQKKESKELTKLSPIIKIEERNFHNAWAKAVQAVIKNGLDTEIGGPDQRKPIKGACMLISLTRGAIEQVESRELHPQFPFKSVDQYRREFTREFVNEYRRGPREGKFPYLYADRLMFYAPIDTAKWLMGIDQLSELREGLAEQREYRITSNRHQIITWVPHIDFSVSSPPCLQRIQIRWLAGDNVDVHLDWRSRDLFSAWQVNIIGVVDMLNREVVKPNHCQIARIIDFNDSLHIYKADIGQAEQVKLVPVSPQEI